MELNAVGSVLPGSRVSVRVCLCPRLPVPVSVCVCVSVRVCLCDNVVMWLHGARGGGGFVLF